MRAALIALCLLLAAGPCQAQKIYRWVGADGKVKYGDMPPSTAKDVQPFDKRIGTTAAAPAAAAAAAAPTDEQELARRQTCTTKAAQLKSFSNATKLIETDALGRKREYTAEERKLLVERTQAELDSQCADLAQP